MDKHNFLYRLRTKQLTDAMEKLLKALDDWSEENSPNLTNCQTLADMAGVHQTYVQQLVVALEEAGFVRLHRYKGKRLKRNGVFVLKGYKALMGIQQQFSE